MPLKQYMDGTQLVAYSAGLVGGANWLTANYADFNLVAQIGVAPNLVYLAVGLASLAAILDLYGVIDLADMEGTDG